MPRPDAPAAGGSNTPSKARQHCSICGVAGVNKLSHVVGHAHAALHDLSVQAPPPSPKAPTPPRAPRPPTPVQRAPGGRTPVHVAIQGDCAFDAYDYGGERCVRRFPERACLKAILNNLMRDGGVTSRKDELVALAAAADDSLGNPAQDRYLRCLRVTPARLQRRELAMRAHATALGKPYKAPATDVDHRVEVQMLTHALLQTAELHSTLRRVQWTEGADRKVVVPPLEQQKESGLPGQTVESTLMPVYKLHNGSLHSANLFNLQLVDSQINRQKKAPFGAFIEAHVCGAVRSEAPAEHLRNLLVSKETGYFYQDPEGAQRYAEALFRDVRETCDAYGPKLRDVKATAAVAHCYTMLGDTMGLLAEEFEHVPRLER